jgi:hypothetical protein
MKQDATIVTFKGIEDKIASLATTDIAGMDAYATDAEAQGYAGAVLGTSSDDSSQNTVYGAKAAANAAQTTANNANTNAETRVLKAGDIMTGNLTVPTLAISSTNGVSHIKFARTSCNYLHANSNSGSIALCANSKLGLDESALVAGNASVYPGKNNTYSLGTSSNKWEKAYVYGEIETGTIKSTSISNGTSTYDRILMASDAGLIGYRTKKEFIADLSISQVYDFKGALANLNALKSITSAEVGDVYFLSDTYHSWACKQKVTSATDDDNYKTYWSDLGKNVDLSGYMTLDTE